MFVAVNAAFENQRTDLSAHVPAPAIFISRALRYMLLFSALLGCFLVKAARPCADLAVRLCWTVIHLLAGSAVLGLRGELYSAAGLIPLSLDSQITAFAGAVLLYFVSALALTNTMVVWRPTSVHQKLTLILALTVATICSVLFEKHFRAIEAAYVSVLLPVTLELVKVILESVGYAVSIDLATEQIAVQEFVVTVESGCLGYHGWTIGLATVGMYLALNRHKLKFPQALYIVPAMIGTLFFANILRLSGLLSIGASVSADIAVQGFHVGSGVIILILVVSACVALLERLPVFSRAPQERRRLTIEDGRVNLLPFGLVLALTLLTTLVTARFDWLYPARTAVVAAAIIFLWRRLELGPLTSMILPVSAGAAVAVLWVFLIPADSEKSAVFAAHLFSEPYSHAVVWVVFRVIGAAVVVPIAEELAFRGYFFDAAVEKTRTFAAGMRNRQLLALGITAAGFALLHGDYLASLMAGLVYGLVKMRRGSTCDAIVAHAVTNGMLAAYVIWGGHWSYW